MEMIAVPTFPAAVNNKQATPCEAQRTVNVTSSVSRGHTQRLRPEQWLRAQSTCTVGVSLCSPNTCSVSRVRIIGSGAQRGDSYNEWRKQNSNTGLSEQESSLLPSAAHGHHCDWWWLPALAGWEGAEMGGPRLKGIPPPLPDWPGQSQDSDSGVCPVPLPLGHVALATCLLA